MKKILFILCSIVGYCAIGADNFWLYDSAAKTMTWVDETGFENVVKTYSVRDGVITLKDSGNKESKTIQTLDLTLPIKDADGSEYTIAGIPTSGFGYNSVMKTVVLPSYIKTISNYAFKNSYALESVTLNDGLEVIGLETFSGCTLLREVNNFFPDSVVDVQDNAFFKCGLECGAIANSLTNLGSRVFHSSGIRSFDCLKSSLKILKEYAFFQTYSLTNVVLNDEIEVMEDGVFESCTALAKVDKLLPPNLKTLGYSKPVFINNSSLEGEVQVGSHLDTLLSRSFRATKIHSFVAKKDSFKTLGQYVFFACNDLTNIVLSATIEKLDYSILEGTGSSSAQRKIYLRNFPSGGITSSLFNGTKTEHITVYLPWEYKEEWRTFAATNTAHTFTFNGETKVLPTLKTELGTWEATITQKVGWWQESPDPLLIFIK